MFANAAEPCCDEGQDAYERTHGNRRLSLCFALASSAQASAALPPP